MSEPFAFSFDILDRGKTMLVHSVIFSSFVLPGSSESTLHLCNRDDDPRFEHFIQYIWRNYLRERKDKLLGELAEVEQKIATSKSELDATISEINRLKP